MLIDRLLMDAKVRMLHYRQIFRYNRSPLRKMQPILIYQMGKVGSSTIRRSIASHNIDMHPYHFHYMNGIGYMMSLCRQQGLPLQDHILSSIYCKKLFKNIKTNNRKLHVISLVREPIAKNISQFFQNIDVSYPEFRYADKVKLLSHNELVTQMIEFFIENFIHDDPLVWFDVELKNFTDIDVFKERFPHEKGYNIYENARFKVLVIRLEDLNKRIEEAMFHFLGISNFNLVRENISSEKEYAVLYEKLKKQIRLPATYIDKMYISKMARHFYTIRELESFRNKWQCSI